MRERDAAAAAETQQSVKTLNIHQLTSLTELRSRVVRCEMSIGRLTAELTAAVNATQALATRQQQQHAQLVDRIHRLETKVLHLFTLSLILL